jgi:hypothetical protein
LEVAVSKRSSAGIWFGAIFGGCGVAALVVGLTLAVRQYSLHQDLLRDGVAVDGRVLEKWVASDRQARSRGDLDLFPTLMVRFRFTAGTGTVVDDRAEVRERAWRALSEQGPIRIRYLAADPRQYEVDGQAVPWVLDGICIAFGLVFGAIGALVLVWDYRERHARRILKRPRRKGGVSP